jgi:hypothetical protein
MHPAYLSLPITLPVLAASILNLFFHWHTPEAWAAFCASSPRLALFVRLSRRVGVDLLGVLRLVRDRTAPWRGKVGLQLGDAPEVPQVGRSGVDAATARMGEALNREQELLKDGPWSGLKAAIDDARTFTGPPVPSLEKWTPPRTVPIAARLVDELARVDAIRSSLDRPRPPTPPTTPRDAILASLEGPVVTGELRDAAAAIGPLRRGADGQLVLTPDLEDALAGDARTTRNEKGAAA